MVVAEYNDLFVGFVGGVLFRWTEMQCSPVFSGNFTPSGHTVKVISAHKVAKMEGFAFVVRISQFKEIFLLKNKKIQSASKHYTELLKCLVVSASRTR